MPYLAMLKNHEKLLYSDIDADDFLTLIISSLAEVKSVSQEYNILSPCCMECRRGLAICLSVCLSVCQTRGLRQNERKICPDFFIPYERSFSLVFSEE